MCWHPGSVVRSIVLFSLMLVHCCFTGSFRAGVKSFIVCFLMVGLWLFLASFYYGTNWSLYRVQRLPSVYPYLVVGVLYRTQRQPHLVLCLMFSVSCLWKTRLSVKYYSGGLQEERLYTEPEPEFWQTNSSFRITSGSGQTWTKIFRKFYKILACCLKNLQILFIFNKK